MPESKPIRSERKLLLVMRLRRVPRWDIVYDTSSSQHGKPRGSPESGNSSREETVQVDRLSAYDTRRGTILVTYSKGKWSVKFNWLGENMYWRVTSRGMLDPHFEVAFDVSLEYWRMRKRRIYGRFIEVEKK